MAISAAAAMCSIFLGTGLGPRSYAIIEQGILALIEVEAGRIAGNIGKRQEFPVIRSAAAIRKPYSAHSKP